MKVFQKGKLENLTIVYNLTHVKDYFYVSDGIYISMQSLIYNTLVYCARKTKFVLTQIISGFIKHFLKFT